MALLDYQFEYINGSTAVVMGKDTEIDILRVQGLFGMEIRDGDRAFSRGHGDLAGEHLLAPKEIFIDLEVIGDPALTTYWNLVYQVQRLFTTQQFPKDIDMLKFKVPGLTERFIRARPLRRNFHRHGLSEGGASLMSVSLKAADPRIYLPVSGMNNSGPQSGTFSIVNAGAANAYPKLTFSSGTTVLTNNTFPVVFTLTGAPAGTVADIDRWVRGVNALLVYSGATSHYDKWIQPRVPFFLGSGTNSITVSSGTVTVEWFDTSI